MIDSLLAIRFINISEGGAWDCRELNEIRSIPDLHFGYPSGKHVQFLCSLTGKIDDAPRNKRPAVIHPYFYCFAVCKVGNFHFGAERKFFMRSGHGRRMEHFPIGRFFTVVRFGVIRCKAGFTPASECTPAAGCKANSEQQAE